MIDRLKDGLRGIDVALANATLRRRREGPVLLAFLGHSLFEHAGERPAAQLNDDPLLTVDDLRRFIDYFLHHGYRFVRPQEIHAGLDPRGHYVLLSFDDGYANNLRAVPVLTSFGVPATFCISTNYVATGRAFWWDVLQRERQRRGADAASIRRETLGLKRRPYRQIEAYVRHAFGTAALAPEGDADRPLTPAELRTLAAEPLVTLANHTSDHAILSVCSDGDARAQIDAGRDYLAALTGTAPDVLAYPNGAVDARVIRLAQAAGVRLGLAVEPRKNRLPLAAGAAMHIARYFLSGGPRMLERCQQARSAIQLRNTLYRAFAATP